MILKTTRTVDKMTFKQKVLLMIGIFMCIELGLMVSSQFSVALPKIIEDIGGVEFYALVFTVNIALSAIATPIVGKLSDMYGRRQILIYGILLILISEMITPLLVSNIYHLMIFRAIQGLGGAAVIVVGLIVISDIFDIENRAKFLGFYGSLNALTAIVAPTVGGIIVENLSWHWIFFSIVPFGIVGIMLVIIFMPEIPRAAYSKFDYAGMSVLSIGILLVVAITTVAGNYLPWSSGITIGLILLFILTVFIFVFSQKRSKNPVIPLHLFQYRVFNICLLACFTSMFAVTGLVYFIPMFLQNIHGFSPTETGIFMTARGITSFIFAAVGGFVVAKLKDFRLVAICALIIFSSIIFAFTFFTTSATFLTIIAICTIWGTASGILVSIFHTGIQINLPNKDISIAISVLQLFISLASLFATSILGMFLRLENLSLGFAALLYTCLTIVLMTLIVFTVTLYGRNLKHNHMDFVQVESEIVDVK